DKKLSPLGVMQTLNKLGGRHGIGRVDIVENRFVGMKGRGVYETPGGAILHFAHRLMETLTMDREVMQLRDSLIPKYSPLVYNVAVAYAVAGWALAQGIAQVFPVFGIPNWAIQLIVLAIAIGFPIALVIAWTFELTPEGIKRTETADSMPPTAGQKKHTWIYI